MIYAFVKHEKFQQWLISSFSILENVDYPAKKPLRGRMEQILIFSSLSGRAKSCWIVGAYMGRKFSFTWEPMPIITGWKPSSKRLICFENTLMSYLSWSVTGRRELG